MVVNTSTDVTAAEATASSTCIGASDGLCSSAPLASSSSRSDAWRAARSLRSARRRSRHFSASADGIGVSRICRQSNLTSGYRASSARRTASSNGWRPTLTSGGVRNQYKTRETDFPRRFT
jgi:hypothetical protein